MCQCQFIVIFDCFMLNFLYFFGWDSGKILCTRGSKGSSWSVLRRIISKTKALNILFINFMLPSIYLIFFFLPRQLFARIQPTMRISSHMIVGNCNLSFLASVICNDVWFYAVTTTFSLVIWSYLIYQGLMKVKLNDNMVCAGHFIWSLSSYRVEWALCDCFRIWEHVKLCSCQLQLSSQS